MTELRAARAVRSGLADALGRLLQLPRRLSTSQIALVSALLASLCAFWSVNTISLAPPGFAPRTVEVAGASAHMIVDAPESWILDQRKTGDDFGTLAAHADLLANVMTTDPVLAVIARKSGIPADQLAARTRLTGVLVRNMREPDSEQRANQIAAARHPYRLDVQVDASRPVVDIYALGPSAAEALGLANAAVSGLQEYLRGESPGVDRKYRVQVHQLGPARGAVLNGMARPEIAAMTFLTVFGLSFALFVLLARARSGWAAARREHELGLVRAPIPMRRIVAAADDWPRTSRPLPWMIAGFLIIVWLLPFNTIELTASLPFDLKLDRLVLPFVAATWLVSIFKGRKSNSGPRPFLTAVHIAIGAFLAVAAVSVVLNAHSLNQALELDLSIKKMLLLGSYVCFFLLVASVVRPSEVPAFLKYTLLLAVLCAIGTIWEYRFAYNVFYDLSDRLLPGIFSVAKAGAGGVDDIGRRVTQGPAEHPLEATTMLTMALPIAIVGLMRAQRRGRTILYGIAACLLFAAAISTYRKSALLAPLSVILTIVYFQRPSPIKMAPLAAVGVVVVHFLSPGAIGSTVVQFSPDRLSVGTVSDRALDYDAVRPDLWTHLLFGRGFASYDHNSYRILDSEILGMLLSVGVLGVVCYLLMLVTIVAAAREPIRSRDPIVSAAALSIAPAAVAFIVVSYLFDAFGFPHGPYILISLAGLLAVLKKPVASGDEPAGAEPSRAGVGVPVRPPRTTARSAVVAGASD